MKTAAQRSSTSMFLSLLLALACQCQHTHSGSAVTTNEHLSTLEATTTELATSFTSAAHHRSTQTDEPLFPSETTSCFDLIEWRNSQGNGCDWYYNNDYEDMETDRCKLFGDALHVFQSSSGNENNTTNSSDDVEEEAVYAYAGLMANQACCHCGGGIRIANNHNNNKSTAIMHPLAAPSTTGPTNTNTNTAGDSETQAVPCVDDTIWSDIQGKTCADYSSITVDDDMNFLTGLTRCELFGDQILPDGTSANKQCCACGGGFAEPFVPSSAARVSMNPASNTVQPTYNGCVNVAEWEDTAGRTCEYYENPITGVNPLQWCLMGNNGLLNKGYVAMTACCACGGGLLMENMIFKEATNVSLRPMRPTLQMEGEPCLDRPEWGSRIGNITASCDTFSFRSIASIEKRSCDQFGHIESDFGSSAMESCCICGGGYNGTLIGKTLRVTFPDDADVEYTLFTNETTGQKDGSIVQFMKDVASAAGFGMYEVKLSPVSRLEHNNNSYTACMLDVELGVTDLCIGPFWKLNDNPMFSNSFFADEFFLVVPRVQESTLELLMTPILPFTWDAWIWVALTCFYMGFVIQIVSKDTAYGQKISLCGRINAVFYNSVKSCAAADVFSSTNKNPSTPEKITVAGFVIFSLIVLTAYTATSAAFLVSIGSGYRSLDDMISSSQNPTLCLPSILQDKFIEENSQASSILKGTDMSAEELLRSVGSDECEGVLISADAFIYLQQKDETICHGLKILLTKTLLTVENVIPTYELLGDVGQEFIRKTNVLIEEGVYADWHSIYSDRFEKLNAERTNNNSRMLRGGKGKGKGSAAAAGSQNTAQSAIGSCGSSDEIDLDKFQLSDIHLLMPISLSLTCSTVGLVMFLVKRVKESDAVQSKAAAVIALNEKDEERLLRQGLRKMSPSNLVAELEKDEAVRAADIEAAVNQLPDKTELLELVFLSKCTENRRDYYVIKNLNVSELCKVVDYYNSAFVTTAQSSSLYDEDQHIDLPSCMSRNKRRTSSSEGTSSDSPGPGVVSTSQQSKRQLSKGLSTFFKSAENEKELCVSLKIEDALNDDEDPKGELIEAILKVSIARRMALRCARIKLAHLSEGNKDKFNIMDHIVGRSPACTSDDENTGLPQSKVDKKTTVMTLHSINLQKTQSRRIRNCLE
eukprot:CAMPEP_0196825136 /NCGR_PEP_ID=MMETSP1362-20130617/92867_1 /TAXON_ID=163516 /ORGANISM="Leptocylindrus danicus, Strain CCMP1856" /LENGTH=1154 /DNA_ID=CAMNT_0042205513 /DNA_START=183 /DNA_END=3647 /DNA_ORIENTATION=-